MPKVKISKPEQFFKSFIQHYNHEKYWRYREKVINCRIGNAVTDNIRLWYIKRQDAFNNASMGTHRNFGAQFATPPKLPHGLNGIIVSHNAVIGKNATIFHQVTIGEGKGGAPTIGDNVLIGAGAKVIGKIKIGNNVRIGAGCVVSCDIADNCTVVLEKPRIIIREG
ncbi:MAG: serine acetyltransferase [Clostridia bacterium]|nr:serine acetyltransferase [Clostridia bacterium]